MSHVSEFNSNKIHDANVETEDKDIDQMISSENEWDVTEFLEKSVRQMKNTDNDSIPEVQFYKTVDTKSSSKFKPLNSSLEVAECK